MGNDPVPMRDVTMTIQRLPVLQKEPWIGQRVLPMKSSRLAKSLFPEIVAPISHHNDKFRRKQARKEILRRALTPPARRPTLRWLNFRPTPSRLCNMSME
ncbi:hypothetical protein ACH5RR_037706 [Cinchona calisaya]|uniref:Uncharacterized protein n=1 Tax=Cinchona calisaya TaxID=153742 RepID=A0ABD2YA06_9GENT